MTKQEFKALCDGILKRYGFMKARGQYYLDLGSDIIGSVHFQSSLYGKAVYINCGFSLKDFNDGLSYPKYRDTNMDWRISVPGKEKLSNKPDSYAYQTEMIKYEYYSADELESSIESALEAWVIPAIQNGLEYILAHDEYYRVMVKVAKRFQRLPDSNCPSIAGETQT